MDRRTRPQDQYNIRMGWKLIILANPFSSYVLRALVRIVLIKHLRLSLRFRSSGTTGSSSTRASRQVDDESDFSLSGSVEDRLGAVSIGGASSCFGKTTDDDEMEETGSAAEATSAGGDSGVSVSGAASGVSGVAQSLPNPSAAEPVGGARRKLPPSAAYLVTRYKQARLIMYFPKLPTSSTRT